jgi:hypothetical protein
MRYYIVCTGLYPGSEPWVLAETSDEAYARDEANTWTTTVVVSRDDALRDPRLREAVLAWDAGDDTRYRTDMVREDAEVARDAVAGELDAEESWGLLLPGDPSEMLTLVEFRLLPPNRDRDQADLLAAYAEYLKLEAAWGTTTEDAPGP